MCLRLFDNTLRSHRAPTLTECSKSRCPASSTGIPRPAAHFGKIDIDDDKEILGQLKLELVKTEADLSKMRASKGLQPMPRDRVQVGFLHATETCTATQRRKAYAEVGGLTVQNSGFVPLGLHCMRD